MRINLESKYLTDIHTVVIDEEIKLNGKFMLDYIPFSTEKTSLIIPYGPNQRVGDAYTIFGKEVEIKPELLNILKIGDEIKLIYLTSVVKGV